MERSAHLIRNPDVVFREADEDSALLFHPDTNRLQVINASGFFLWNHCDGTRTLEAMAGALFDEFDGMPAAKEVVVDQVNRFLDDLLASGFITATAVAAGSDSSRSPELTEE